MSKEAKLYERAARRIANNQNQYCCRAIEDVEGDEVKFSEWFNPMNGSHMWFGFHLDEEIQLARSLALLFMAEIERDEYGNASK